MSGLGIMELEQGAHCFDVGTDGVVKNGMLVMRGRANRSRLGCSANWPATRRRDRGWRRAQDKVEGTEQEVLRKTMGVICRRLKCNGI